MNVTGLGGLSYWERLGLFSPEHRELRSNFIQVYEIKRSVDKVNS